MKMMCTTSVEANGYTVFRKGKVYDFEKIRDEEDKVISYQGSHEYGTFLVSKGDPQIKANFMKKKKYDELFGADEEPVLEDTTVSNYGNFEALEIKKVSNIHELSIGDKVLIRSDLEENTFYGDGELYGYMSDYLGEVATITNIDIDDDIEIDLDDENHYWTFEMIKGLVVEKATVEEEEEEDSEVRDSEECDTSNCDFPYCRCKLN